jgi:hypothetical protein
LFNQLNKNGRVCLALKGKFSVKDLISSLGVPVILRSNPSLRKLASTCNNLKLREPRLMCSSFNLREL